MIAFSNFQRRYKAHRADIDRTVARVLRSGWFILGRELDQFEREFAGHLGVKHVIGVNSGTDALYLALRALGVGAGDEVLTVANTATPTVSAIRMTGAVPAFADIDPATYNVSPSALGRAISWRTKAIVPVHLFGFPADMAAINAVAKARGVPVVEDAAQAAGASFRGRKAGTFGTLACFSFYPTKNLGAFGDAGAVVTSDAALADRVRRLRNYGEQSKYVNVEEGVNSRLDEMQAALLRWGLGKLDTWTRRRAEIAGMYSEQLHGLPIGLPPAGDASHTPAWHLYVIRTRRRDALRRFLKAEGVETSVHYPAPIYRQPAYEFLKYTDADLPATASAMAEILSLPIYPELTDGECARVCRAVRRYYARRR